MEEGNGSQKIVWSDKDEITLLKALKKAEDKSDMATLYHLVKPSLDIPNLSERMVTKKVSSLERKFIKSSAKQRRPTSTGHDALVHKLGKKIWGRKASRVGPYMTKQEYLDRYPLLNKSIDIMYRHTFGGFKEMIKDSMVFVSPKKLDEMENEWDQYYQEEMEDEAKGQAILREILKRVEDKRAEKAYNDSAGASDSKID